MDALITAAAAGDLPEVIERQKGHPLIGRAFFAAIHEGRREVVQWYLDSGIDPDVERDSFSPCVAAAHSRHYDLALHLWDHSLTREADKVYWGGTLLDALLSQQNFVELERAIAHGVPWTIVRRDGELPAQVLTVETLRFFVPLGFDVNRAHREGEPLLTYASTSDGYIEALLDAGARGNGTPIDDFLTYEPPSDAVLRRLLRSGCHTTGETISRVRRASTARLLRQAGLPAWGVPSLVDAAARVVRAMGPPPTGTLPPECLSRVRMDHLNV